MSDEQFLRAVTDALRDAGLHASLLVRDLTDGRELAVEVEAVWPLASVAKLPLAVAVLLAIERGDLDPAMPVRLEPRSSDFGTGTTRFRHRSLIAVEDLVALALTISDNGAADALLDLIGPSGVNAALDTLGITGLVIRRSFRDLAETPLERLGSSEGHLAHALAIRGGTTASSHPLPQLDTSRTNVGTARAVSELLAAIWDGRSLPASVSGRLQTLLAANLLRHRLSPDLASDTTRWSSKTGTLLNLRHEAGVVQHHDGERYSVVVLSSSSVAASTQPAAEAALGGAARALHRRLRGRIPT